MRLAGLVHYVSNRKVGRRPDYAADCTNGKIGAGIGQAAFYKEAGQADIRFKTARRYYRPIFDWPVHLYM